MHTATVAAVADAAAAVADAVVAAVLIVTYSISDDRYRSICFVRSKLNKQTNKHSFTPLFQLYAHDDIPSSSPALLPFHLSLFYVSSIIFLLSITY